MKTNHQNISIIQSVLSENNIDISKLGITATLVKDIYHNHLIKNYSNIDFFDSKSKIDLYEKQYEFIRRDLLKIKYKQNDNCAQGISEGFVYAISNPAFPGYIKIGSTIDVYERLNTYQTYSPYRDYKLINYFFSYNRLTDETALISKHEHLNEWCKISENDINDIFREEKRSRKIQIDPEIKDCLLSEYRIAALTNGKDIKLPTLAINYAKQYAREVLKSGEDLRAFQCSFNSKNWINNINSFDVYQATHVTTKVTITIKCKDRKPTFIKMSRT